MMRIFALLALFSGIAFGQVGPVVFTSTSSPCATIGVGSKVSQIAITVTGTFSGTLQPELAQQGQAAANTQIVPSTSSTAASTITAAGTYFTVNIAGADTFLLCPTTFASGSATIYLNLSTAGAAHGTGSGGGGAFSAITAGTNTTAAMVVGTGASLAVSGSGTIAATSVPFSGITSGANTSAAMQNSTGSSLSPLNIGQVVGSQGWLQPGLTAPTSSGANSGGSIIAGHNWLIQYTFQTAAGETLPSVVLSGGTTALTSGVCVGNTCTLTIVAPTFPSGYTGWNVYACDTSGGGACTTAQLRAACQNLGAGVNCTFTAPQLTNTTSVPTLSTAVLQPPNVQATNGPAGFVPSIFFQKADGNYYPWAGVEWASCDPTNGPDPVCGTPMFTHRTYFNDTQSATVQGKNAFVSIDHLAGVGASAFATNQDRNAWFGLKTPTNDATARYGLEDIQAELDFNCNGCSITGSPDGEVTVGSFQLSDLAATNYSITGQSGTIRASYFKSGAGTNASGMNVFNGTYAFNNAAAVAAGTNANIFKATCTNSVGGAIANHSCVGMRFNTVSGSSNRFSNGQVALFVPAGLTPGANDLLIRSDILGYVSKFGGALWLGDNPALVTAASTLNVIGSLNSTGGLATTQLATPTFTTPACTGGGAATWTYVVVAKDVNGGTTAKSSNMNATCATTLDGSHFVTLQAMTSPGTTSYDIYRTASGGTPSSLGLIGSATPVFAGGGATAPTVNFVDTGLAGDSATATSVNTTGGVVGYNFGTLTNCAAVGTAASPSVASCSSASAGAFSCATNASAATCTINTTAVGANSEIIVQEVVSEGTRLGVTCNTAPTVTPAILLASKTADVGFTINMPTITVNPACFDYWIVNR